MAFSQSIALTFPNTLRVTPSKFFTGHSPKGCVKPSLAWADQGGELAQAKLSLGAQQQCSAHHLGLIPLDVCSRTWCLCEPVPEPERA